MKSNQEVIGTTPLVRAAARLGVGRSTAYKLAREGRFPGAFQLGSQWFVANRQLERLLNGEQASR